MRFLIMNGSYNEFLRYLYAQHPGLEKQPYDEQMKIRVQGLHGMVDFYPSNLRKLGHEAWNIYANDVIIQMTWERNMAYTQDDLGSGAFACDEVLSLRLS